MTRSFKSLGDFALFMGGLAAIVERNKHEGLEKAARIVEDEAKRVIGTYDARPTWKQLAEVTQEERSRKGFSPNEPLLRTGTLRDSIQHTVRDDEAQIGSNEDRAVAQELGTSKIPPRSFLVSSVVRKKDQIAKALTDPVVKTLTKG